MKINQNVPLAAQIKGMKRPRKKVTFLDNPVLTGARVLSEAIVKATEPSWEKVDAPKAWKPQDGEVIEGKYCGSIMKGGIRGDYEAHYIRTSEGMYIVSGVRIDELFATANVTMGNIVNIVFKGMKKFGRTKTIKEYDLYVR